MAGLGNAICGRLALGAALACCAATSPALGQTAPLAEAKRLGEYDLHDFAAKVMMQQDDLAEIGFYRAANRSLPPPAAERPRLILFGASITYHWTADRLADFGPVEIVNRGIAGQNSSQMLLRFEQDVVALRPSAVVIVEMTNDLRVYFGPADSPAASRALLERLGSNIRAMADIAGANGIKVALATIPPIGADHRRLQRDPATLAAANAWIREFAASRRYPLLDLHAALADRDGDLPAALAPDGIHPTAQGYERLAPALRAAISALKLGARRP